jgi:EpsI family protein
VRLTEQKNGLAANRIAFVVAALMIAASVATLAMRPTERLADRYPQVSLERMIPKRFGEWHEDLQSQMLVVDPQVDAALGKVYNQVLSRIYVNAGGYRIMLSIAYGEDQRGPLHAHRPDVCYPAQGFEIEKIRDGVLTTSFGTIPVRRLTAVMGARREPVTYWLLVGDTVTRGRWEPRLATLRYGLLGQIADGLVFRVSSIDGDNLHAYREQDAFVSQLLQGMSPVERTRLTGIRARPGTTAHR